MVVATFPACVSRLAYNAGLATCRQQILSRGICEIEGLVKPVVVSKLLGAAESLSRRQGVGFRSFERHNVYLEESATNMAGLGAVRSKSFESSKLLINQQELSEECPELLELYRWDGMRELMQEAFGLPSLYESSDPVGGVCLNLYERGDRLGWHFDRSEYSVNLILRECPSNTPDDAANRHGSMLEDASHGPLGEPHASDSRPGAFMYFPDSRDFFDGQPDFNMKRLDHWTNSRKDQELGLVVPNLKPGTVYLFAGNKSLHCVSENTTDVARVNAIFSFNTRPNEALNEYTRKKFYGV